MAKKTWFITGISSGLGKALTQALIEKGEYVIGTFRNKAQTDTFNIQHADRAHAITLDICEAREVEEAYRHIQKTFGKVDVLINNAGFGLAGAIEETSIHEAREVFEANFFGTLRLTQTFLPLFRRQKHGHIIQISSHGGIKAFAGFGIYNASKFALEGFSEALAQEIAPLGVKLTIVEPGPFRTSFAGPSFRQAKVRIDDYNDTAGIFRERVKHGDGKQEGDPRKAAQAIIDIAKLDAPPLRLPLGRIALQSITAKLALVQTDINNYRHIAESTVF